jgi:hypothetical protein
MKKQWMLLFAFSVVIVLAQLTSGVSRADKKYKLEYGIVSKDGFRIDAVKRHKNERIIMGNEMVNVSTDRYGYGFSALSSGDEGVVFEVEYLERAHETDDPQVLQDPDFSELIGKKVSFLLSPTGEASRFEGFTELPSVMIVDEQRELDERFYIIDIRETFPGLPEEKVGIGDSWTVTREYEEPVGDGSVSVKTVYTYTVAGEKKIDGYDCLLVDGKYDVLVSGDLTAGGLDLAMKLEGEGVESFTFAPKKGMFLYCNSDLMIDGAAVNEDIGVTLNFKHEYKVDITTKFD